jgi:23S rRNA (uracil1939-C5)-methyltransferase
MDQAVLNDPSKPEVEPLCPVFAACGGCAYQHLPYEEELRLKESGLHALLAERLNLGPEKFTPITASPKPYYYRNRLDLTLRRSRGTTIMGFQSAATHRLVPVESCVIAREEVSKFIPELKRGRRPRALGRHRTPLAAPCAG